jgi:hypothetical protein
VSIIDGGYPEAGITVKRLDQLMESVKKEFNRLYGGELPLYSLSLFCEEG